MSGFSCQQQLLLVNAVAKYKKAVFQALFKQTQCCLGSQPSESLFPLPVCLEAAQRGRD